ncbi:MAG: UDP-N-acetylmuramate dehydrogenase [Chitinivibrionia bacterium]|nr:UDP-N-acetylmuramate dehydrogenase [Chitinivibrionia bacterium]
MKRGKTNIEKSLRDMLGPGLKLDEPMARHTTIGVGGRSRFFALPRSSRCVASLIRLASANRVPCMIIGRGSNLIVRDGGFDGLIIKLGSNFSAVKVHKRTVFAQAGASLSGLASRLVKMGRPGLEFAVGIPGSVGGGVWMNAGAYGGEIAHVLSRMTIIDRSGAVRTIRPKQRGFGYRQSNLPRGSVILTASFLCPPGGLNRKILQLSRRRKRTQPLEFRSFGCAFVNPPGEHAGRLIEGCGLKGTRIGGAVISEKHANFILNIGPDTKTSHIEDLIRLARQAVKETYGIILKPEVVIVGNP